MCGHGLAEGCGSRISARGAGAPHPRPFPQHGGRENFIAAESPERTGRHRTASVGRPSPRPLPARSSRRGGEISQRSNTAAARCDGGSRHPSPEVGGGVDGRCEERAKRPSGERAPAGAVRCRSPSLVPSFSLPHALRRSLWGEGRGRGARPSCRTRLLSVTRPRRRPPGPAPPPPSPAAPPPAPSRGRARRGAEPARA
jgi:hypothetical protein